MRTRLFLFSLLLWGHNYVNANGLPDPVVLTSADFVTLGNQMVYYVDSTNHAPVGSVLNEIQQGQFNRAEKPNPNFGITNATYWAFFRVQNTTANPQNVLVHIDNFLMDTVRCFSVGPNGLTPLGLAGDYIPYGVRVIKNRNIVFPYRLEPNQTVSFLVSVFKDHSSVSLPIKLWRQEAFYSNDTKETLLYGFYFGVLLLLLLYAFVLYVNSRKWLLLYYFLYIAFLFLFQFNHLGFAYAYLWPNSSFMSNYGFWVIGVLMTVSFIYFARHFTRLKQTAPLLDFYFSIIGYLLLAFALVILFFSGGLTTYTSIAKKFYYYVQLTSGLGFVLVVGLLLRAGTLEGRYFSMGFGALFVFGVVYVLREVGIAPYNFFTQNTLVIGSLVEILVFALGITHLINNTFKERELLWQQVQNKHKELISNTIDTEERERKRIAMELHDSVGSQLSFLKVSIENSSKKNPAEVVRQLDHLAKTVRRISHDMNPAVLEMEGLQTAINNLIEKVNLSDSTLFRVEWIDFPKDIEQIKALTIYRIVQEAVGNIIKHAKAPNAYIQFTGYPTELTLAIEDDGQGIPAGSNKGTGLKNIEIRVNQLSGTLELDTQPGKGTSLLISIPV